MSNSVKRIELQKDNVLEVVLLRKSELEKVLEEVNKGLLNVPNGTLRVSDRKNGMQYYHRTEGNDTKGKYIRKADRNLAVSLARKDYYLRLKKELESELHAIDCFLKLYHPENMIDLHKSLHRGRKALLDMFWISDQDYVQRWKEEEYLKKEFAEGAPEYYTDRGERVRSKSEIIIADKLDRMGIPYRYEYPVATTKWYEFHPDFYCLNIRTREEFAWEHCGMMDDPGYTSNLVSKIREYGEMGYWLGKNLILTFETVSNPLNIKTLEKTIEKYLL